MNWLSDEKFIIVLCLLQSSAILLLLTVDLPPIHEL